MRRSSPSRRHDVGAAIEAYETSARSRRYLERIPVRQREEVIIVPVHQIASIVAEGELLHLTTVHGERSHDHLPAEGSRGATRPGPLSSGSVAARWPISI